MLSTETVPRPINTTHLTWVPGSLDLEAEPKIAKKIWATATLLYACQTRSEWDFLFTHGPPPFQDKLETRYS